MLKTIKSILSELEPLKIPIIHEPIEGKLDPPFMCYSVPSAEVRYSDDGFAAISDFHFNLELYTVKRDFELENRLLGILSFAGEISMSSEYIYEENLHASSFEFNFQSKERI